MDHRLRPALDLIERIPLAGVDRIFDLGCGAGRATRVMAERWPQARITGVDGSPEMLEEAKAGGGDLDWLEADLNGWSPNEPAGLIFSNAVLHWLDDHQTLFPRLMEGLGPGGVLAVQMPDNYARPSHTGLAAVVREGPWMGRLIPLLREVPVHPPAFYRKLLSPLASMLEVWETEYVFDLEGENPVAEWVRGTALKPFLDALAEEERDAFLADYSARMKDAYPKQTNGMTRFPFKRLFIVAVKG